jgi:glycosyltransferase involved in cell wall biosynthesis
MEQQLVRLGAPRERVHYNPCGVDAVRFAGANPAAAPPLFVAVGRFVDKKGPHLTLLAFQRALQVYPSARLVMIGAGSLWDACQQMAQALGIRDAVTFTGPLPHSEVAAWMQQARAFVQHSVQSGTGDAEGTPVAVLEAGASGLPVVSTRHGGISDVVVHDQTGFLVAERDIEGMARAMLRLVADAALAGVMGANACEHIRANFSMEQSIARLWSVLEGVVDTP